MPLTAIFFGEKSRLRALLDHFSIIEDPREPWKVAHPLPEVLLLTKEQAEKFYAVHAERSFFSDLCVFMTSGPVVVQVLEGEGAVARNRDIMGATNPANAAPGTIRADFAESVEANSVHGSDSAENAANEIAFFFAQTEIVG